MTKIRISDINYRLQIAETDTSRKPFVYSLLLKAQCPECGHFELNRAVYGVALAGEHWGNEHDFSMSALDALPDSEDKKKIIKHVNEMIGEVED